jgi:hypothetical protein
VFDLDGDGSLEYVIGYEHSPSGMASAALLIVDEQADKWVKVWDKSMPGTSFDQIGIFDLNRDGHLEIVVGWYLGLSSGTALDVLEYASPPGEYVPVTRVLWSTTCAYLDVSDYNLDNRWEIALWREDANGMLWPDVYQVPQGFGRAPVMDETAGYLYYARAANYYRELAKETEQYRRATFYLAQALIRSVPTDGRALPPDFDRAAALAEALAQAKKGVLASGDSPSDAAFSILQGETSLLDGKYETALELFREGRGNAPYLTAPPSTALPENGVTAEQMARAFYGSGLANEALGNAAEAMRGFQTAELYDAVWPLPYRAIEQLNLAPVVGRIMAALAGKPGEVWAEALRDVSSEFQANSPNAVFGYVMASRVTDSKASSIALVDAGYPGTNQGVHLIIWRGDDGKLQNQAYYVGDELRHGLGVNSHAVAANLTAQGLVAVYEPEYTHGGPSRPTPYLFWLDDQNSSVRWTPPANIWRNGDGQITFTAEGGFVVKSSSWGLEDIKSHIFRESRFGPNRAFTETWVPQSPLSSSAGFFELKVSTTEATAYNTLVEFVYALSTGDLDAAEKYVSGPSLIDRALNLQMLQAPLGQEWELELLAPEITPPAPAGETDPATAQIRIADGPARGLVVSFTQLDGNWLISGISR